MKFDIKFAPLNLFDHMIKVSLQLNEFTWGDGSRAPGSQLNPMKTGCLPIQPTTPPTSLLDGHSGHCSIPASPTYHKMRTSSGDSCRMRNQILGLGEFLNSSHCSVDYSCSCCCSEYHKRHQCYRICEVKICCQCETLYQELHQGESSPKSSGAFSRNLDQVWHEASISSQGTCRSWVRGEIGRKMMVVPQPTTCPLHRDPASVCACKLTLLCVCLRLFV